MYAHGEPIDLLANNATGHLFALSDVNPGTFGLASGASESTLPGLGVRFDSNGIAIGTQLSLDFTQPLLYWDGVEVATPTDVLQVISPGNGHSLFVDSQSPPQVGMLLGTYDGTFAWEADPTYRLNSIDAAAGVYGLAVRVTSPSYEASTPFLIPLVHDPLDLWDGVQIAAAVELLRGEVVVRGSADFDADGDVDGSDFLAWQLGFGTISLTTLPSDGDADLDSDVDANDLSFWQQQFGQGANSAQADSFLVSRTVPEPVALPLLAIIAGLSFNARPRSRRPLR